MEKVAVIYWSGTGNTEKMALAIADGIKQQGNEVDLLEVNKADPAEIGNYTKIAFGCSAMGDEVLEEGDFDPFFTSIEKQLQGKKIALFGSYGWGDGKWMRDWYDRASSSGANVYDEGLMINGAPDAEGTATCTDYGKQFAAY